MHNYKGLIRYFKFKDTRQINKEVDKALGITWFKKICWGIRNVFSVTKKPVKKKVDVNKIIDCVKNTDH